MTNNRDEIPSAAQRGRWISSLAVTGVTGQQLASLIAPGKTRQQIWDDLREFAKTRKK